MKENNQSYTVLLLSAPIGSGHKLAAEALEQELSTYNNIRVVHGNIFDFFPGWIGSTFLSTYLKILEYCPWLYELAYKWGNKESGSLWLRGLLNRLLAKLGSGYLKRVNPDAVVSTHATPAGIIGIYKEQHPELWQGAVVTDYTIHRWWINEGVDTYFIADEALADKIPVKYETLAYGIPVRKSFLGLEKSSCRMEQGWSEDELVCLLMGGGEGLLPMEELAESILKQKQDFPKSLRLVAITGRNEALAKRLQQRFGERLEVYGFREDAPKLMAAADMVVSKAGGLTSAEVLVCGLSFVIYRPLPGQETGNAEFLQKHFGVKVAHTLPEVEKLLVEMALQPSPQKPAGKPLATTRICKEILKHLA